MQFQMKGDAILDFNNVNICIYNINFMVDKFQLLRRIYLYYQYISRKVVLK